MEVLIRIEWQARRNCLKMWSDFERGGKSRGVSFLKSWKRSWKGDGVKNDKSLCDFFGSHAKSTNHTQKITKKRTIKWD